MKISESIAMKASATLLFLCIAAALILIWNSPSQGYELSIYGALPPAVWGLLATAIVGGSVITVYQTRQDEEQRSQWWGVGLLLVLLGNLTVVLLPAIRGYAFSDSGDHLSHVGWVIDILQTGSFADNVYPVTHTLIAAVCLILNMAPVDVVNFAGPFFYLIFVASTYLLSREILPWRAAVLATVASTVLFCYYYIEVFPMGFAFILFPLILFLYFRSLRQSSAAVIILLICLIGLMAVFHPLASFILTLGLLVMELVKLLLSKPCITRRVLGKFSQPWAQRASLNLPVISLAIVMLWIWNRTGFWRTGIFSMYHLFRGELLGQNMLVRASEAFVALQLGFIGRLEVFVKLYGHIFIFLVLTLVGLIMLIRNKPSLSPREKGNITVYYCLFYLLAAIQFVDYIRPLTILTTGRVLWLVVALLPPLVGLVLYQVGVIRRQSGRSTRNLPSRWSWRQVPYMATVASILIFCSLLGVFAIYPSPFIYQPNPQVTGMEFAGHRWLLEHGNPDMEYFSITQSLHRSQHALYGTLTPRLFQRQEHYDDHFNYTEYEQYGESSAADRYLLLSKCDRLVYTELWPAARFTGEDFARLEEDPSVSELYTGGEMSVYYVSATAVTP